MLIMLHWSSSSTSSLYAKLGSCWKKLNIYYTDVKVVSIFSLSSSYGSMKVTFYSFFRKRQKEWLHIKTNIQTAAHTLNFSDN